MSKFFTRCASLAVVLCISACGPRVSVPPPSMQAEQPISFTVADVRGGSLTLEDYRGHYVLLHFWASWCVPCAGELSDLQKFQKSMGTRDLAVIAIAVQSDWDAVNHLVNSLKVGYPVGLDKTGALEEAFQIGGVPATFLLDRSGRLIKIYDPADGQLKTMISGARPWAKPSTVEAYQNLIKLD
ncbi:MAG: TlpA family protein disulfide reductase [Deltaproteobacteria bacterium]|nr:TlpA family protein disulfide reductase [Deltaproteobacteria bacterium]